SATSASTPAFASAERLAQEARALEPVAPRVIDGLGDADARARHDRRLAGAPVEGEGGAVERQPVLGAGHAQRLADFPRPRAELSLVREAASSPHRSKTGGRFQRSDEDGASRAFRLADEVQA